MAVFRRTAAARLRRVVARERRREPRFSCQKLVRAVYLCRQFQGWVVQSSARGVAIVAQLEVPVGEQFMIQLMLDRLALLVYTVRGCTELRPGVWRIGAELQQISAPGAVGYESIRRALESN